jgi:hypothetical protein
MTFYLIRIPLFIFFPIIWYFGYLVEKPRLTKFGKVGTIISSSLLAVLVAYYFLFAKKPKKP